MAGSIRLVRGKDVWELRVYLGRDANGKVRHLSRRFQGSRRAAERELAFLVTSEDAKRIDAGSEKANQWGPNTTLNDAIEAWRKNGWEDLSPSTVRRYESIVDVHIKPTIGKRRISSLSPYEVERFFRNLKTQGLSQSSVHQVRAVMARACRLARRWSGNTLPNPVADTELPMWSMSERLSVRAPDVEEVKTLLSGAKDESLNVYVFLRVIVATGMRRGEGCALRWSDIDWDLSGITVDESVVAAKGHAEVKSPKTRSSIRIVAIDYVTLNELRRLRAAQEKLATEAGVLVNEDGFVFSFEPGGTVPPYPDTMSKAFADVRKRANVYPDVHLHSLRHFQATELDAVISERQKQARLGWSSAHMARHYTDPIAIEDRRAAEHIAQILGDQDDLEVEEPESS